MAIAVVLPKQGNSVESCLIQGWKVKVGDTVKEGDVLCEVETDKAVVEVTATASGTILALFAKQGDDVPVMQNIVAIGKPGEDASGLAPAGAAAPEAPAPVAAPVVSVAPVQQAAAAPASTASGSSPRARAAANAAGLDISSIPATGPEGRVIERDVAAVVAGGPRLSPVAKDAIGKGGLAAPAAGSGVGGRVLAGDLSAPCACETAPKAVTATETIPLTKIRKVIAERMQTSIRNHAQYTLTMTVKAKALQDYRAKCKEQAETLGLPNITVGDLIAFAVSRVLLRFPDLNAHFDGKNLTRFSKVHLGLAVDTERGLMVPVIENACCKTLGQLAKEFKPLAKACQDGKVDPARLSGSTFTISNLGALGVEGFTPVLNAPEVAILGVGGIHLRPYEGAEGLEFLPSMTLSLTADHQVVDGAPAARFLKALCQALENIELLLAV